MCLVVCVWFDLVGFVVCFWELYADSVLSADDLVVVDTMLVWCLGVFWVWVAYVCCLLIWWFASCCLLWCGFVFVCFCCLWFVVECFVVWPVDALFCVCWFVLWVWCRFALCLGCV